MKKAARIFIYCWMVFIGLFLLTVFTSKSLPEGNILTVEQINSANLSQIVGSVSPKSRLIWIAGGLVSGGLCLLWLRLLDVRELRNPVTLLLGLFVLMLGSFGAGYGTALDILRVSIQRAWDVPLAGENLNKYEHPFLDVTFSLTLAVLILLTAYALCFRRKKVPVNARLRKAGIFLMIIGLLCLLGATAGDPKPVGTMIWCATAALGVILVRKAEKQHLFAGLRSTAASTTVSSRKPISILKRLLSSAGAPSAKATPHDVTPLMTAAYNGEMEAAEALLADGVDPNAKDDDRRTALMFAAAKGHTGIVNLLLNYRADPNLRELAYGRTALMGAAHKGHLDTVEALLAGDADANAKDNDHMTAMDLAKEAEHSEIVQMLKDAGAWE